MIYDGGAAWRKIGTDPRRTGAMISSCDDPALAAPPPLGQRTLAPSRLAHGPCGADSRMEPQYHYRAEELMIERMFLVYCLSLGAILMGGHAAQAQASLPNLGGTYA